MAAGATWTLVLGVFSFFFPLTGGLRWKCGRWSGRDEWVTASPGPSIGLSSDTKSERRVFLLCTGASLPPPPPPFPRFSFFSSRQHVFSECSCFLGYLRLNICYLTVVASVLLERERGFNWVPKTWFDFSFLFFLPSEVKLGETRLCIFIFFLMQS